MCDPGRGAVFAARATHAHAWLCPYMANFRKFHARTRPPVPDTVGVAVFAVHPRGPP
ncbi:hypothetical protein BRPE64_ACDS18250 [Caballeronia insecticola]|uniref:Uncharacterized protein n=1 Tax=Caballeronia insecticola TaxID=758793 RepID=R4WHJ6_9BURK|nr:hypothetical protein BRPE64_ACDS18250 [Caballeronia insecticola]